MRKRYLAVLFSVCMLFGVAAAPQKMYAAETKESYLEEAFMAPETEENLPSGGLLPIVEMTLPETEEDDFAEPKAEPENIRTRYAAVDASYWDKYTNYYFYNQMKEDERKFWDSLEAMCRDYLIRNTQAEAVGSFYRTRLVKGVGEMTMDDMKKVASIFRWSNPQYYFLNHMFYKTQDGSSISFGVYNAFAKTEDRAAETQKVKTQIERWQSQIDACATDEEKVRLIHDLIIQKVEYDHSSEEIIRQDTNAQLEWENKAYSQTAYSVFCTDLTVCAGYSQAFEMMCNGSGIDAVAVTSDSHEWNKVRVNDSWYNVDCTWDDQNQTVYYNYFERNDKVFDQNPMHYEEDFWEGYLPDCTLDSGATRYDPGTLPPISQKTSSPVIRIEKTAGGDVVTLESGTPDADIYYSLDGVQPKVRAAKCYKYAGSFELTESALLQAVAVSNGYWDSETVKEDVRIEKGYTITYDGNGATSGSMEPQLFVFGDAERLRENQYIKDGYQFAGWNTMPDGSGSSYENGALFPDFSKDTTLYAQWKTIAYALRYELDGGTNGKNPTEYNCTQSITLSDPEKTGYTFQGWYTDSDYTNAAYSIAAGSTGDKVFYAKWEPNQYVIIFKGNGSGSGSMAELTGLKYNMAYRLSPNSFKKTGYTFGGWNTKKDGSGVSYKNKQSIRGLTAKEGGAVTLYAQWSKKNYTVTYKLKGGKNCKKNPASYTIETPSITLRNPKRTGYQFLGWYRDSGYKKKVTKISRGSTGNLTLYARWKIKSYTITYKLNGGINNRKNVSKYHYNSKTIRLKNPTRKGYRFAGWYADSKYKKKVAKIPKGSAGNLTLYAKWKKGNH